MEDPLHPLREAISMAEGWEEERLREVHNEIVNRRGERDNP